MDSSWQKKWDGRWDQFKGKVKQTWGQMTDDDCDVAEGKYDEMVGRIKTRTGEAEEEVRERLSARSSQWLVRCPHPTDGYTSGAGRCASLVA